jgi:hypothetical protein
MPCQRRVGAGGVRRADGVAIGNEKMLVRAGGATPAEMRDLRSYADAYGRSRSLADGCPAGAVHGGVPRTKWIARATLGSMSPTVFRDGRYRFYFNSREEDRMHVHVESPDGQLKVWLEPRIELADNYEIPGREVTKILRIIEDRHGEIERRWHEHRGS